MDISKITTDIPESTVCLWKGREVYAHATTNDEGTAEFTIAPTSVGQLFVTVSGANLNTVTKSIPVE